MKKNSMRLLSFLLATLMVIAMFPAGVFAEDTSNGAGVTVENSSGSASDSKAETQETPTVSEGMDFTAATGDLSGEGWAWSQDTKTLTLSGVSVQTKIVLPDGATLVAAAGTENDVAVAEGNAIYVDGSLTVSGKGKLSVESGFEVDNARAILATASITVKDTELSAKAQCAVAAPSVSITDAKVDLYGYFYGIHAKTTAGTADSVVTLNNVSGKIAGYGYGGINAHSETANVSVLLKDCHDLEMYNEVDNDSTSVNFNFAGIRAYTRGNGKDVTVSLVDCENVTISNSTMAILAANNANAANEAAADVLVSIEGCKKLELKAQTSCYSAVFVNNYGIENDDSAVLSIKNSELNVAAPNATALMASTKSAPSNIKIDGSSVVIDAGLTGIRTIASSADYAETTISEDSTIQFVNYPGANFVDESVGSTATPDENYTEFEVLNWYNPNASELHITSAEDLWAFAAAARKLVEDGSTTPFAGQTVYLDADIDLNWAEWYPLNFYGTFEGGNHTISNLTYIPRDDGRMGFFQTISGPVSDLILDGIKGTVPANGRFGGFSRYLNARAENVHVKNIEVTTTDTLAWVGGFTTYSAGGSTLDCSVTNLTVNAQAGADLIAGFVSLTSNRQLYENSDVKGFKVIVNDTDSSGCGVGGFAGQTQTGWNNPKFKDCDITGIDVTASGLVDVGGFIAWPGAHTEYAINCHTQGVIDATGVTSSGCFAGGFFGNLGWNCDLGYMGHYVEGCTADVDITTKVAAAGGFVGSATNSNNNSMYATFTDCSATGDITCVAEGTANIGGFAGEADRGLMTNVTASGTVTNNGTGVAGAFIGLVKDVTPKYDNRYPAGTRDYLTDDIMVNDCEYTGDSELAPFGEVADGVKLTVDGVVYGTEDAGDVFVAKIGTKYYKTFAEAIEAANAAENGATVALLADVTLDAKVTVTGNVTVSGAFTITRDAAYTGTLFAVEAGATLTLDGGLTIDGGNAWTYTVFPPIMDMNNGAGTYVANHITPAEGGVNATAHMIVNNGTLNVNSVTIENSYSTGGFSLINAGENSVTILDGATVRHTAANRSGAVAYIGGINAVLTIKGTTRITDNFGIGNGGIIQNYGQGTTVNFEGGSIDNNFVGKSGTLYASYSSNANKINTFNMTGGIITKNVMEGYGPVYIHTNTVWNMTGGEISENISFLPSYVRNNNPAGSMTGGKIVNNEITGLDYSNGYYVTHPDLRLNGKTAITGGTYTQDVSEYLAPDTGLAYDAVSGTYTTTEAIFEYNGQTYQTLAEVIVAIKAAPVALSAEAPVVKLVASTKVDETIIIDVDMVLDLNGKTIYADASMNSTPVIRVLANVTVTGNGKIDGRPGTSSYAFIVGQGETAGNLTIEDGTFYGDTTAVSVTKGTATINGGSFAVNPYVVEGQEDNYNFLLNCIDANYKDGSAKFIVKGGSFYKFNPANNAAEGAGTSFVAENYLAEADGDYYTVRVNRDTLPAVVDIVIKLEGGSTVTLTYPSERFDTIQKLIGTNDYADFVLGAEQNEMLAAVANGNVTEIVMNLYDDIALDAPINFYNKYFSVPATYDITIKGNNKTITWADGYNGTLINVESGVGVTLSNVKIMGGNTFTFYNDTTTVEDGQNWYTRFVDVGEEDKAINANVIVNAGDLTLNRVTIAGVTIASDGDNGKTANTETGGFYLMYNDDLAIIKSNGGTVALNDSRIDCNAGLILNAINAKTEINGTGITGNMGAGNKGGIIIANGGTMSITDATINNNKAMARSATILGVINGAEVSFNGLSTMNNNKHIGVGSNTAGAMIVLEGASQFVMNGGSISNNVGGRAGAIASRWVGGSYGQHEDTSIVLNAGTIEGNTASNDSWNGASVFLRSPAAIGEDMKVNGIIAVNAAPGALEITGGEFNGSLIVADGLTAEITGGTFDYDPSEWLADGYVAPKNDDGTYTARVQSYVEWVKEQLLAGNDVTLTEDIVITDYDLVNAIPLPSNSNGRYNEAHGNGAVFHIIKPGVELDLNGHSITWDAHDDAYCNKRQVSLFMVTATGVAGETADFTIKDSVGTGKVDVYGMGTGVYVVLTTAKATVAGGTWTNYPCKTCGASNIFMYPSHGGTLEITGGTFEQKDSEYLLGCLGSTKETNDNGVGVDYDSTQIIISGGTFVGFNPENVKFFDFAGSDTAPETVNGCELGLMAKDNGDGTYGIKEWDLVVRNTEDLQRFAAMVNAGNTFAGKTIELGADIDLAGINWTPIGNDTNYFCGNFDGQNHTISNMTIDVNTPDANQFVGLFGGVKKSTIKNLTMTNVKIDVVGAKVRAAAVVGIAHSNSENRTDAAINFENITVNGCTINAEAKSGSALIGGVVGYCYPANLANINVSDLTINAKAEGKEVRAAAILGYLCGQNISNNGNTRAAMLVDTFNVENVSITADAYTVFAGGYAPYTYYGYITLEDGTIDGLKIDVDAHEAFVGGLVGYFWRSDNGHTVKNVHITNIDFDVTTDYLGETRVGGMVGTSQSPRTTYTDCSVSGTIVERCSDPENPVNYHAKVGGFVARTYEYAQQTYTNCVADVDITASNVAGGFVGNHNSTVSYVNCVAKGDVTANIAGGFAGRLTEHGYTTDVTFQGCESHGNVTGTNVAGGFIGSTANHGWNAWVAGNGTAYGKNVTIKDCIVTGTATSGTDYCAGVVGEAKMADGKYLNLENVSYVVEPACYPYSESIKNYVIELTDAEGNKTLYADLAEAIAAAQSGDTITLLDNVSLTAPVTVPAGKAITLDLNDCTLSYTSDVAGEAMITNNGELTVKGEGTIVYTYTGAADSAYTKGNYTINNSGKLVIDGATVQNTTAAMSHAYYAVNNGNGGEVILESGLIENLTNCAVRLFGKGSLTVNGGEIKGTRAVWMQAPGSNTADAPAISLTVTDGKLTATGENGGYKLAVYSYNYGNSPANVNITVSGGVLDGDIALTGGKNKTVAETVTVTGGTINNIYSYAEDEVAKNTVNVSGGTFNVRVKDDYLADGFIPTENDDGTYSVVSGEYVAMIDGVTYGIVDALKHWTNGKTMTLIADVTLPDVIKLSSTENHILDLGDYTMTAASGKNAIEILSYGYANRAERPALTIKAGEGGINAGSKSCVYYKYDATLANNQYDRPIIYITGGVFNGSSYSGLSSNGHTSAQDKCATFNISGGTFNCGLNLTKTKLIISGGTFNSGVNCTGGGTSYRQITGGKFKSFGFMTADAASKFFIGAGAGNYNVGVYVDDNGYLVVGGPVITEPGTQFAASSANYSGWNSYLKYSSAAANGLYYTSILEALADNNKTSGSVNVYVDTIDLSALNYKGTMVITDSLTVTYNEGTTPAWTVKAADAGKYVYVKETVANGVVTAVYTVGEMPVAQIGEELFETLADAIAAAKAGDTITLLGNVTENVTVNKSITIDGNGNDFTGTMTLTKVNVTIQNVDFVKGNVYKHKSTGIGGNFVIKNCTFDGQNAINYAIELGGTTTITVENCTAKDYVYGFLQVPASNVSVSVKDVTVSGVNYGVKIDYSSGVTLENVNITANVAGVLNSNFGAKTITIKNSTINSITTWERNTTVKTTIVFEGANTVGDLSKATLTTLKLADAATLTAPEGLTVITDKADHKVVYENGTYKVAPKVYVAEVNGVKYESLQDAINACKNGETVKLIADIVYGDDDIVFAHGGATGFGNYDQYNPSIIYVGGTKGETPAQNLPSDVNVVIDLNGHTITNNANAHLFLLMDNCQVTFTDSLGDGKVISHSTSYPSIWVCGTDTLVTIEKGYYETDSALGLLHATHSGDLVIYGGEFKTTAEDASLLIMLNSQKYNNPNYFLKGVATVTIYGGIFHGFNPNYVGDDYGASSIEDIKFVDGCGDNYEPVDNGDGTFGVVPTKLIKVEVEMIPGAWGTSYITVENWADLVAALGENTNLPVKITLLEDVVISETLVIAGDKTVVIDLNGKTITTAATEAGTYVDAITVLADVTITGAGVIDARPSHGYTFYVGDKAGNSGKLTIENGSFYGETSVVNNRLGTVAIKGGYFEVSVENEGDPIAYLINCIDENYRNGTASIIVTGGTFAGFDPANNAAENAGTSFVAKGYKSVDNGDGSFTVKANMIFKLHIIDPMTGAPAYIPYIEGNDLASVIATGKSFYAGYYQMTLEILGDWAVDSTVIIDYPMTIDLGGYTVSAENTVVNGPVFRILSDVTVKNGTVDGRDGSSCYAFIVGNGTTAGSLTIVDGKYYGDTSVVSVTNGTLTALGGYFEATEYNGAHEFTLNCIDSAYNNGNAVIVVKGGSFYKFNPADNAAEGVGTDFVHDYYKAYVDTDNSDCYLVKKVTVTIGSVEDLLAFAAAVTGKTEYQGVQVAANPEAIVLLTADLDLTDSGFVGIGNGAANAFSGTFDGQNHTISNMTLSCNYYRGVGFFRSLGKGAVIKNLTFVNADVNNGAATGANHFYGVVAGFSNNLTLDNVNVIDSKVTCKYAGSALVGCLEGATTVKNCDIENVTLRTTNIRGAVFGILGNSASGHTITAENNTVKGFSFIVNNEFKDAELTLGYGAWNAGNEYAEERYVAQIGDAKYSTLANAIAAAKDGDTITLIGDVTRAATLIVDKDVTIDLNGYTVYGSKLIDTAPAIRVLADVTVKNGTVDGRDGSSCYAFIVGNGTTAGSLTIVDGTYYGDTTVVSVTNGTLTVLGGYFEATEYNGAHEFTLNCIDSAYNNGNAVIVVKGGSFYGFNPENNAAEGANTNFVAEDYGVNVADSVYTVVKAVVEMDGKYYATIKDALATLSSADTTVHTVKVLQDHDIDVNYSTFNYPILVNGFSIVLDLNGKTINADWSKYAGSRKDNALIGLANGGKLTVTGNGTINNLSDGKDDVENRIFWLSNAHSTKESVLTIENGTFNQYEDINLLYVEGLTASSNKKGYFTYIKGGEFNMLDPNFTDFFNSYDGRKQETVLTGGIFSHDPTDPEMKIHEDFRVRALSNGKWKVVPLVTVVFDDFTIVDGNELPEFTYTTNFNDVAEDGAMLIVPDPVVNVNGAGEYDITSDAYVFMSEDYVVEVTAGTLTVVERVLTVNGVAFNSWDDAMATINANTGWNKTCNIVLYADVDTVNNGFNPNGTVNVDLNGYTWTSHWLGISYNTVVTVTNSSDKTANVVVAGQDNRVVLGANSVLNLDGDIDFEGTIQLNNGAQNTTGYFQLDGKNIIGDKDSLFVASDSTVRVIIKDNFLNITTVYGHLTLTEDWATKPNQTIVLGSQTGITVAEGVTLTIDPTTSLTLNGYVKGEGTVVVNTLEHFEQIMATEIKNIEIGSTIVLSEDYVLDLAGKKITSSEGVVTAFRVTDGANVTVKNADMNTAGYAFILGASDGSTAGYLTIESGKFHSVTTVASVTNGKLTVLDGEFSVTPYNGNYAYLFNCIDANYNKGIASIEISGGIFHNWDPEDNAAEGKNTDFVADRHASVEIDENVWKVVDVIDVTVTLDDKTMVIGNAQPEYTYSLSDAALADVIKVTFNAINVTAVGTYEISATVEADSLYNVTVVKATLTVVDAVAQIGSTNFASLRDALAAAEDGDTIVILKDHAMDGTDAMNDPVHGYDNLAVLDGKAVTLDFNGHTISVQPDCDDTDDNALADCLESVIFVANGGNLTVTDTVGNGGFYVTKGATNLYCLIYNSDGSTVTVKNGNFYIEETVQNGAVIYADGNNTTSIEGGNFTLVNAGSYDNTKPWITNVEGKNSGNFVQVTGGTFNQNPYLNRFTAKDWEVNVPENFAVVNNGNGTWSVVPAVVYIEEDYIPGYKTGYATLADALAALDNGETIVFVKDFSENVTIKQTAGLSFTINGNGKTFGGTITIDGAGRIDGEETLTITNVNFLAETAGQSSIITKKSSLAHNVTIDGCTFTGTDAQNAYGITLQHAYDITVKNVTGTKLYDLVYGKFAVTGFVAENVTVTETGTGFWFTSVKDASFKNVDVKADNAIGIKNAMSGTMTFEDCSFEAEIPVYMWLSTANVAYSMIFNGTNNMVATSEDGNWLVINEAKSAGFKVTLNDTGLDVNGIDSVVAKIGNNVYYNSVAYAVKDAQDGETVVVIADDTSAKEIIANNNVTLDLNGFDVTGNLVVNGNLTIKDSTVEAEENYDDAGKLSGTVTVNNGATLTIYAGIYTQNVDEYCADHYLARDNKNGTWTVCRGVVFNKTTGQAFLTIADAMANAMTTAGKDHIVLLEDHFENIVIVYDNTILDLGTFDLTTNYVIVFKGGNLTGNTYSSTKDHGKLIVAQRDTNVIFDGEGYINANGYTVLPTWDAEQGCYVFSYFVMTTSGGNRGYKYDVDNDTARVTFKIQSSGSAVRDLLLDGIANHGINIVLTVTCKKDGNAVTQDYVYSDELLKECFSTTSNLTFQLGNVSSLSDVTFELKVVSETGAYQSGGVVTLAECQQ